MDEDPIMVNSIAEKLIGELLIDPVRVSHAILADLEEMGWPRQEGLPGPAVTPPG